MLSDLSDQLTKEFPHKIYNSFIITDKKTYHQSPYGECKVAEFQAPNDKVLLREFSRSELTNDQATAYTNEIRFLLGISHPFSVPCIGATYQPPFFFISQNSGAPTLFEAIHSQQFKRELTGNDKTRIALCICSCMMYLHSLSFINYDLHPQNIIFPEKGFPQLTNFGLKPLNKYFPELNKKYFHPHQWMPPEIYQNSPISPKSDVYSFGIILWEIYTQHFPLGNVKPENFHEKVIVKQERPIIPIETPKTMKKLMELCWNPDPEKRPSFKQIYQLFVTGRVQFENTDKSVIDEIVKIVDDFQQKIKPPPKEFKNISDIPAFFKTAKVNEIYEYTQGLNETNCSIFYNGIYDLVSDPTASTEVKEKGLFEILKRIVSNEKCLEIYAKSQKERQLPFLITGLAEVSLSILIPVLTKYPQSYISDYLGLFESLLSQFPLKIIRLIYILSSGPFDHKVTGQFMLFILKYSQVFMQNDCTFPMVQTIYKLLIKDKQLIAEQNPQIIKLLSICLLAPSNETLVATYSLLEFIRPGMIAVDPSILVRHIKDHAIKHDVLKVLCCTRPFKVTDQLIAALLDECQTSQHAKYALFLLAKFADVQSTFIENSDLIFLNPEVDPEVSIKILLILLQDPKLTIHAFQQKGGVTNQCAQNILVLYEDGFPQMLTRALNKLTTPMIMSISNILTRLPPESTSTLVERLAQTGFITNLAMIALKNPEIRFYTYYVYNSLGKGNCYVNEFVELLPAAIEDLKTSDILRTYAIGYCELLKKSYRGREGLKNNNVSALIQELAARKLI